MIEAQALDLSIKFYGIGPENETLEKHCKQHS